MRLDERPTDVGRTLVLAEDEHGRAPHPGRRARRRLTTQLLAKLVDASLVNKGSTSRFVPQHVEQQVEHEAYLMLVARRRLM